MNERPNYYAVIPANIMFDPSLTASAKLLYGQISALCNEKGYCWADNNYFAKINNVHADTISGWISELASQKHVKIDGNTTKRKIQLSVKTPVGDFTYRRKRRELSAKTPEATLYISELNSIAATAAEEWDFKKALAKLEDSSQRHLNIIAWYIDVKKLAPRNARQLSEIIARFGRVASALAKADYTDDELIAAKNKVAKKYDDWTLETIQKEFTK